MDRLKNKLIRLYINSDFEKGREILLSKNQANYISNVMRKKIGDMIKVFGNKEEWLARIIYISKKSVTVSLLEKTISFTGANEMNLIFAPIKNSRISFIIEKATELGVSNLIPIVTDHSVVKSFNLERAEAIAIEAAEQSERSDIPKIANIQNLKILLDSWDSNKLIIFCNEREEANHISKIFDKASRDDISILTGPEGGFSNNEIDMLKSYSFIFSVSLGRNILRSETAIIAALSFLMINR